MTKQVVSLLCLLCFSALLEAGGFERLYSINGNWYGVEASCVPDRQFGSAQDARRYGGDADQRAFGDAQDQRQFGDAADQRQFGDAADQRQFGDAADQRQFGDAADQRQFGDAEDQRQFGDAEDQRQFGDAADQRSFGDAEDQRSFGGDQNEITCQKNIDNSGFVLLGLPAEAMPVLRDERIGELRWVGIGWMVLTDRDMIQLY